MADRALYPYLSSSRQPERDPLFAFALRWWWLLVIGVVLGVGGAFAWREYGPISYSSSALIQVPATVSTDATANAEQARSATANFAAEAASTRTLALASAALGQSGPSTSDLQRMQQDGTLAIEANRFANFIEVTVVDRDPDRARLIANTIAGVFVDDVNARADEQFTAREQQLQDKINFTRDQLAVAQLFERDQTLEQQIRDQRSQLLSLETSLQEIISRPGTSINDPDAPLGVSSELEGALRSQIGDIQQNIATLTEDLDTVRAQIAALPEGSDASVSGAFASAYTLQLSNLTSTYVNEQVDALTAGDPVVKYGDASQPLPTSGLRRFGLIGVALGVALTAAIGFLIDLLRNRRRGPQPRELEPSELEQLIERLERLDLLDRERLRADRTTNGNAAATRGSQH